MNACARTVFFLLLLLFYTRAIAVRARDRDDYKYGTVRNDGDVDDRRYT
jgi:hypothetical protein